MMGNFALWHWIVVLGVLGFVAAMVGIVVWLIARSAKPPRSTVESRLDELATLKSKGHISEAEYSQRRSSILEGI